MTKQAPKKKTFGRSVKTAHSVLETIPAKTLRMKTADLGKNYVNAVAQASGHIPEFVDVNVVRGTGAVIVRSWTAKEALLVGVRKDQREPNLGSPVRANGKDVIVARLSQRMASKGKAEDWYRHHKIPAFGHRTPSQLVRMGMTDAVVKYLDGLDSGAYA
jgi:hypothetical protein